jgi:hypothetical protein
MRKWKGLSERGCIADKNKEFPSLKALRQCSLVLLVKINFREGKV